MEHTQPACKEHDTPTLLTTYLSGLSIPDYTSLLSALGLSAKTSISATIDCLTHLSYIDLSNALLTTSIISDNSFWKSLFFQVSPAIGAFLADIDITNNMKVMYRDYSPLSYYETGDGAKVYHYSFWEHLYSECELALNNPAIRRVLSTMINQDIWWINTERKQLPKLLDYPFLSVFLGVESRAVRIAIIDNDSPLYKYLQFPLKSTILNEAKRGGRNVLLHILQEAPDTTLISDEVLCLALFSAIEHRYVDIVDLYWKGELSLHLHAFLLDNKHERRDLRSVLSSASIETLDKMYEVFPAVFDDPQILSDKNVASIAVDTINLAAMTSDKGYADSLAFYMRIRPFIAFETDPNLLAIALKKNVTACIDLLWKLSTADTISEIPAEYIFRTGNVLFFEKVLSLHPQKIQRLDVGTLKGYIPSQNVEDLLLTLMKRPEYHGKDVIKVYQWAREKNFTRVLRYLEALRDADLEAGNITAFVIVCKYSGRAALETYLQSVNKGRLRVAILSASFHLWRRGFKQSDHLQVVIEFLRVYLDVITDNSWSFAVPDTLYENEDVRDLLDQSMQADSPILVEAIYHLLGHVLLVNTVRTLLPHNCNIVPLLYILTKKEYDLKTLCDDVFEMVVYEHPSYAKYIYNLPLMREKRYNKQKLLVERLLGHESIVTVLQRVITSRPSMLLEYVIKQDLYGVVCHLLKYPEKSVDDDAISAAVVWSKDVTELLLMRTYKKGALPMKTWKVIIDKDMYSLGRKLIKYDSGELSETLLSLALQKECSWLVEEVLAHPVRKRLPSAKTLFESTQECIILVLRALELEYSRRCEKVCLVSGKEQLVREKEGLTYNHRFPAYLSQEYTILEGVNWRDTSDDVVCIAIAFSSHPLTDNGEHFLKMAENRDSSSIIHALLLRSDFDPSRSDRLAHFIARRKDNLKLVRKLSNVPGFIV